MLDLPTRATHYRPPPPGGLNRRVCETHECFLVQPAVLLGERGIELPLDARWFFEDADAARAGAREWLARIARSPQISGARAHVRHAEVLIDPATGEPTTQLDGPASILDLMPIGCALDDPFEQWTGARAARVLQ